jgi:hypothetical protein
VSANTTVLVCQVDYCPNLPLDRTSARCAGRLSFTGYERAEAAQLQTLSATNAIR